MQPFLKLLGQLDWFLPRGLVRKASVDRIRARIFVALAFFPLLTATCHQLFFDEPRFAEATPAFILLHAGLLTAALAFIRQTGRFRSGAFLYLIGIQLVTCLGIILSQSIHSIAYAWIPLRIIVAVLILEAPLAFWIVLIYMFITVATIHINQVHGLALPAGQTLASFTLSNIFMLLAIEGLLIVIGLLFENFRRKKQEAFLQERARIAQSLGIYALGEMVGGVSHEVNNPLAITMGLLIQYEKLAQSGTARIGLDDMQQKFDRSLQRIRYVVEGLKTFAEGELNEAIEENSVRRISDQLRTLNQESLQEGGIQLKFTDRTTNMSFLCRPHQLLRTLQGLIINAIEACEAFPRGLIEVRTWRERDHLFIEVSDNGKGVPVELRHRIFEPFFSTKSFQTGQGLTLATSKGLMEAQGGHMSYQPLPIGSRFTICLPLDPTLSAGDAHELQTLHPAHPGIWQKMFGYAGSKSRTLSALG